MFIRNIIIISSITIFISLNFIYFL